MIRNCSFAANAHINETKTVDTHTVHLLF